MNLLESAAPLIIMTVILLIGLRIALSLLLGRENARRIVDHAIVASFKFTIDLFFDLVRRVFRR